MKSCHYIPTMDGCAAAVALAFLLRRFVEAPFLRLKPWVDRTLGSGAEPARSDQVISDAEEGAAFLAMAGR